jgi:FAD-dependent oxidoreductase domain-containing protein 1
MKPDILVIGAGALGLSSAYHLKRRYPEKSVLVVDRHGGPGQGNSAKSEGAFRNTFTSETNYLLADSTIDWFTHLQEEMGHDIKLGFIGYLWLFSEEQHRHVKPAISRMAEHGVELRELGKEELHNAIPDLVTDLGDDEEVELIGLESIETGLFCPKSGSLDVDALVRSYEEEFLKLGGEVSYGTEVHKLMLKGEPELGIPGEPFVWQEMRIAGAETSRGEIEAETTVVAAGVWSETLLDPIGVDAMMRAKKRQLFVFKDPKLDGLMDVKGLNEEGALPLTVLPKSGVFLKAEVTEGSVWLGCADDLGRPFDLEDDPQAEEDYYTDSLYHVLVKYFPCFADLRPVNSWAGQYAVNSFDGAPVVSGEPGMIYVGAASGSGIMKCDSLGRIVAAFHAGEEEAELFGGRKFRVADLGVSERRVEKETFII